MHSPIDRLKEEVSLWLETTSGEVLPEATVILFLESQPASELVGEETIIPQIEEMLTERGYSLHVIYESPLDPDIRTFLPLNRDMFWMYNTKLGESYKVVELWESTAPFRVAAWNLAAYRHLRAVNKTEQLKRIRQMYPKALLFTGAGLMTPIEIRASGLFSSVYGRKESPVVLETPFAQTVREYEQMLWNLISKGREYSSSTVSSIIKGFDFEASILQRTIVQRVLADFAIFVKTGKMFDPNCSQTISEALLRESHYITIEAMCEAEGHPAIAMGLIAKQLGYKTQQYLPEPPADVMLPMDV